MKQLINFRLILICNGGNGSSLELMFGGMCRLTVLLKRRSAGLERHHEGFGAQQLGDLRREAPKDWR